MITIKDIEEKEFGRFAIKWNFKGFSLGEIVNKFEPYWESIKDGPFEISKKATAFFDFWEKEIIAEDNSSSVMPRKIKGTVVGLKTDAVLIRSNNNLTDWWYFSKLEARFFFELKTLDKITGGD